MGRPSPLSGDNCRSFLTRLLPVIQPFFISDADNGGVGSLHLPDATKGTTMLVLKGCPRCNGDLLLVTSMDGRSANCLQCGYSRELPAPPPGEHLPAATAPARRQRDLRAHVAMRRSARLATLPSRGA
jgi:hypothetical protein